MSGQIENVVGRSSATSSRPSDDEVRRTADLSDRIAKLEQGPLALRTLRWFLLGFLGLAFGVKAILAADWPFLIQTILIMAFAVGLNESVTWWYVRKIKVLEREMKELVGPGS